MTAELKVVPSGRNCTKCKVYKSFSEFYKHNSPDANGHTSRCKECIKEDNKSRRGKHNLNPELVKERRKRWMEGVKKDPEKLAKYRAMKNKWNRSDKYYDNYYKKRFGISLAEVQAMLSRQNGLCSNIGCSVPISIMGKDETKSQGVVDHSHKTGKVRALLCVRCNAMLGHIENNSQLIPGFMDYLNKHNEL